MAERSVDNLMLAIEASKKVSLERLLFGLGIRYIGETVSKVLVKEFKTIDAMIEADFETLVAIDEIGAKIAESVVDWFSVQKNIDLINSLKLSGLEFKSSIRAELSNKLEGMRIVISGTFQQYSRRELKKMIEDHGGNNVGSISKNTTFVLAGDNMGARKKQKAEDLEILIVSEREFLEKLN